MQPACGSIRHHSFRWYGEAQRLRSQRQRVRSLVGDIDAGHESTQEPFGDEHTQIAALQSGTPRSAVGERAIERKWEATVERDLTNVEE